MLTFYIEGEVHYNSLNKVYKIARGYTIIGLFYKESFSKEKIWNEYFLYRETNFHIMKDLKI